MDMLSIHNIVQINQILRISTKDSGRMEKSMERDMKYGQMEPNSKECTKMIKNQDLDLYIQQMDLSTKANSKME